MNTETKDWKKYESGKKYNNRLKPNYYATIDTNLAFFSGDQWRNVQANGMPTPVFNMIKRCITFFVASLTSSKVSIHYEPLAYSNESPNDKMTQDKNASDIATAEVENLFEKFKMDNRIRDALFDAATMGDIAAHIYFDRNKKPYGGAFSDIKGEICFELVDGSNVMFGNANNPSTDPSVQPWVIIIGRDMVENLKAEAKQWNQQQSEIDSITDDDLFGEQAGDSGKIEIEADIAGDEYGKALYIIVYRYDRETETIKVSKCTQNAYMYKDIDTELKYYPVAWLPWEKQKNQYHGRAVCTGLIHNQIFINRMFAMVMYHLMMAAFPKAVYDADKINHWTNEIGVAIPMRNLGQGESIQNIAGYLKPGDMSNQIVQVIELAIQYTKETLGINDAMMGNINPEQASGKSIVATVQQASVPLQNQKANLYEWIEGIGQILLDMMGTYYGSRPIVISNGNNKEIKEFDFSSLKNLWLNVKTDVGDASYWSELASVQTLDNMLSQGLIDVIDYLESLPDGYIMHKQDLIDRLKAKQAQANPNSTPENSIGLEQMMQFIQSLPQEIQVKLEQLAQQDPQAFEQEVMSLMQQHIQQAG